MNTLARYDAPPPLLVEGVLDALPDLVCQFLADMTLTYANTRFCRVYGCKAADLIGSSVLDLIAVEHRSNFAAKLGGISRESRETRFEQRTIDRNRKSLWQSWTLTAQFDAAGTVVGYLAIVRDITEPRRYQDAFQALMDLVTEKHATLDDAVDALLDLGRRYYGADIGVACNMAGAVHSVRNVVVGEGMPFRREQSDAHETLCTIVKGLGDIVSISHLADSEYGDCGLDRDCGLASYIGAPLRVANAHCGVLSFSSAAARQMPLTPQEQSFLKLAAQWLSHQIEHHETQQEADRRNQELEFIFDQLPARIWYKDDANRIVRINQAAAQYVGIEPGQAIGRPVEEFFSDEAREYHQKDLEVLDAGEPRCGVLEDMPDKAGQRKWAVVDKIPHRDEKTGDRCLLIVANDVTDSMRYRNALEELMAMVNQGHEDVGETLRGILGIGCRYFNLSIGAVSRIVGGAFRDEHVLSLDSVVKLGARLDLTAKLFEMDAGTDVPMAFHDLNADDLYDLPDCAGYGYTCFIGCRIVIGGLDYGVLSFVSAKARGVEFSLEELNFIKVAAHSVAMEIERHQTLDELHRSEMNLRFIFDNVPSRIIYKDDTNRILKLNANAARSMGLSVQEAEGADTYELFPAMARKYHDDDLAVLESGKPTLGIIEEYTPRDGESGWVQTDKIPYVDERSGQRRILAVISDITPLKEAEEALRTVNADLRRQQEYFKALYRRTPAMMHSVDKMGRIVEVSNKWLEKLGYARDEVIGRSLSDFLDENSRQLALEEVMPQFFATGRCDNAHYQFVASDGSGMSIELSAIQDRDGPDGERSFAVLDDVTRREQAQAALVQRNADLELANANLEQFAYVASHDLQEPLRKIQAFSDLVRHAVSEDNQEDLEFGLGVLVSEATRSRHLVSDLLAFSRTGNQEIECQPTTLATVLIEVFQRLQLQIDETGAQIKVNGSAASLNADFGLLCRLIQNLLANGIQYLHPDRSPEITIDVETSEDGSARAIIIGDNGIGFDPKYRDMIFKPFKRLHTRDEYPGTGIGLAICATAARRHGWSLTADSQPGKGSTFRIDLIAQS